MWIKSVNYHLNCVLKQIVVKVLVEVQQHVHEYVLQVELSGDCNANASVLEPRFTNPFVRVHADLGVMAEIMKRVVLFEIPRLLSYSHRLFRVDRSVALEIRSAHHKWSKHSKYIAAVVE